MAMVRRTRTTSRYVRTSEEGHLIIQPPKSASHWSYDFKLRISKHWLAPKTIKPIDEFERVYVSTGWQDTVYSIEGRPLQVRNLVMVSPPTNKLIVVKTVIVDSTTCAAVDLVHTDFLMRIMLVYCFVKEERIGGVPELPIYQLDADCYS